MKEEKKGGEEALAGRRKEVCDDCGGRRGYAMGSRTNGRKRK